MNNKAKQQSTPKAVTFPKKNELPRVGLEPTTLYTLDRVLYYHRPTPRQLSSHVGDPEDVDFEKQDNDLC